MKIKISLALLFLVLVLISVGPIMSNVEQPNYNLIKKTKNIEIRHYKRLLYAETAITGQRQESISTGFRIIADYIFGNNRLTDSDSESSKIAMTSPVIQEKISDSNWKIKFIMPQSFTLQNLPLPNNEKIIITEGNDEYYITIRFSGSSNQKNLDKNHKILLDHISENNIEISGSTIFAFYNPPWTLPIFRRNEILYKINYD